MQNATAQVKPPPPSPRQRPRARAGRVHGPVVSVPVPVPKKRLAERVDPLWIVIGLVLVSLSIHVGVAYGAAMLGFLHRQAIKITERITVAVVDKKPDPPKVEEPLPEPPKPPPVKKAVKPKALPPPPPDAPPPPPDQPDLPPPPNEVAPVNTPPPMVIPGISFSSTSNNGSFKVGVGNTLYGKPSNTAAKPEEVKPYKAERYAPPHQLSESPVYLENISDDEMARFYPEEARRSGAEGRVKARITIDDDGSVVKVEILEHPGLGFDAAAKKLLMKYRFKPARVDGVAVATTVPFTITFELPY